MLFTMPERGARMPLWNSDKLRVNIIAYVDRYQSDFEDVVEWVREEVGAMDSVMEALSEITAVPPDVWDQFHARWREVSLLYVHLIYPPNYISEEGMIDHFAEQLEQFFDNDEKWLQARPNNN